MKGLGYGLSCGLLLLLAPLYGAASGASVQPQAPPAEAKPAPGAAGFDVSDCQSCHEKAVDHMAKTPHARIEGGCSACHGDVSAHIKSVTEKGDPGPVTSFLKMKARDVNATCQGCHEKSHNETWAGSMHERRGLSCTSCHSAHDSKSARSQLKTASELDTCFSCHATIRSQGLRTSHHPVREGLMTCSSCHNPHDGSRPKMVKGESTNELCFTCHAEKRGPFLWEHAPVQESCLNCHNPHGSNHDKMLVSQQPWLCQRCHLNTRHPGTVYTALNAAGDVPTASNRAVEHACKNCHQNVHGGNAPSGPYLGR